MTPVPRLTTKFYLYAYGYAPAAPGSTVMPMCFLKTCCILLCLQLISGSIRMSLVPLLLALFLTFVGVLMFGSMMYYAEQGLWDEEHQRFEVEGTRRYYK